MNVADRFWAKVDQSGDCWLWTASVVAGPRGGYGQFRSGGQGSKMVKAHVWAYEHLIGPIPVEKRLDHLCRERRCVRPDHLEPVTNQENVRRGLASEFKTECANGHPYTPENTQVIKHRGVRVCRICYVDRYTRANAARSKR